MCPSAAATALNCRPPWRRRTRPTAPNPVLAAASHDLRQPLAALSLYLGLLRGQVPADSLALMRNVDDCVASLSELLDDLLDVSKLDAGVVTVEAPISRSIRC